MLAAATLAAPDGRAARREAVEPLGVWSCIVYDDPVRGNERVVLNLRDDGAVYVATQFDNTLSLWRRASDWRIENATLRFDDHHSRRDFEADLEGTTLGGAWRSTRGEGGWWCRSRGGTGSEPLVLDRTPAEFFVPKLVPHLMVSPVYPRQAIREAREGRVVACFLVDSSGTVLDAELVEVSDEIFAEPTLRVLARSKYNVLPASSGDKPGHSTGLAAERLGCRTYTYQLDAKY